MEAVPQLGSAPRQLRYSQQRNVPYRPSCQVAEHCWDPVGHAIATYGYLFEGLSQTRQRELSVSVREDLECGKWVTTFQVCGPRRTARSTTAAICVMRAT